MNTPNPLVPQGTLQSKSKSTVRIAIFTIISIHAVFFAGLLMQGCRRDEAKAPIQTAEVDTNQNTLAPLDPGYYGAGQDFGGTSPPPPYTPPAPAYATEVPLSLPTSVSPEVEGKPYTIAKGDTLARIAKINRVTLDALSKANPTVEPSRLRPGQKIYIPAATLASPSGFGFQEPASVDSGASPGNVHTVRSGDTLTRIAKQNATTVRAIRAANNLKSDRLRIGQKLKLPASTSAKTSAAAPSAVSKLTATNPAHVLPMSGTDIR